MFPLSRALNGWHCATWAITSCKRTEAAHHCRRVDTISNFQVTNDRDISFVSRTWRMIPWLDSGWTNVQKVTSSWNTRPSLSTLCTDHMLIVSVENVQYCCIFFHQVCESQQIMWTLLMIRNLNVTLKKLSKMKNVAAWPYEKSSNLTLKSVSQSILPWCLLAPTFKSSQSISYTPLSSKTNNWYDWNHLRTGIFLIIILININITISGRS